MSVWIRRGLLGVAGLIVLVVAAAAIFIASFDANKYKGVAIDWMKTHRQRTLVIDGPIELSMFPRLAMKVSKITLSEASKPDNFAAIDGASLAVDVLPLLHGEVVVGRVEAHGVRVTYLRDAKGRSNIDDLLAGDTTPTEGQGASKPVRFDVSGIVLSDVKAVVHDEMTGTHGQLLVQSFNSGRLANRVEAPVDMALQFDFRQPLVKGTLSGDTRLMLDTETQSASLKKMNLGFKGDAPGLSAVDLALKGAVAWDGTKKSVNAEDLSVKLSGHTGSLKHDGTTLAIERFAFEPQAQNLTLRKLQAAVKATQAGQPVTLDLEWPELVIAGKSLSGSAFSGKLTHGGDMPLSARFKSTAPSGNFDAVRLPGFEAQVESDAPQRKLAGTLRSDLVIKPSPFSLALDKLDLQAKVQEPGLQPLALNVRGNALASPQKSGWNIAGQLNDNKFATEGTAVLAGDTPQVNARANFDSLDLNKVLASSKGASAPAPAKTGADTPIDLSGLRAVNAQVALTAGRFVFQQYKVGDARIQASLDGGMLRITELQGKAWGGQLSATAFADARASRIAIKGAATGVDVNALVKDVAAKDWIEGTGRVSFDLDSAGRSVNEMKSRLKGTAALQLRDGAIKGINLAKTLRQAQAALGKKDAQQKANQTEKTDFSELSASFQIADGVAHNRDLDMKSPFLRLGGEGAIDVGRSRIDYVAKATVVSTTKGQEGADLAALKGLTIPVRLTGPFESLDWKIEWSAIATQAATKKIEDVLGEKLGLKPAAGGASKPSAADALKKGLKGLFK